MKQTPYCQKSSFGEIGGEAPNIPVGLFSMAWMANTLNKKIECYQQYGLTSYLASCSTSLSTRKTYLATTGYLDIRSGAKPPTGTKGSLNLESIIQSNWKATPSDREPKVPNWISSVSERKARNDRLPSHLLTATSLWISETKPLASEGLSVRITPNYYTWADSFVSGVSLNKADLSFHEGQQNNDSVDEATISKLRMGHSNTTCSEAKLSAFKVSRDYVSSDSSEGFEDWSFLDQKRPYDSLVRENIFELLEDLELNIKEGSNFNVGFETFGSERFAFEEHLFSSEINKTYTNRLRLEQRIKKFYGLSALPDTEGIHRKEGDSSSYDTLLQIEKRIDVQLFRLKWVSSISHARQILKHKHIGIINCKDRLGSFANPHKVSEIAKVASSNLFLKAGDLLYWRNKDISTSYGQQLAYTQGVSVGNKITRSGGKTPNCDNLHKFPWFGYIAITSDSNNSPETFGSERVVSDRKISPSNQENKASSVFALGSDYGSVSLLNDMNQLLTVLPLTEALGSEGEAFEKNMPVGLQEIVEGAPKEAAKKSFLTKQSASSLQKLSKYFETHYKYTYAIRTNQDLKLEYLRLPQSSIQKNEWKGFLESSI